MPSDNDSNLAISKTIKARIIPGGGPGGSTVKAPGNPPETPLPAALQSPNVKTVEDARGVQAASDQWQGDGDGHWSNH
jgi:hypothetical protein